MKDENVENDKAVELARRRVLDLITLESERLFEEVLKIVYNPEVEAKVKLPAISLLLDRGLPKLGVEHAKESETEESGTSKRLRSEIEALVNKGKNG